MSINVNLAIIIVTMLVCGVGIVFGIWSFIDTRKKHYQDYVSRKRKNG